MAPRPTTGAALLVGAALAAQLACSVPAARDTSGRASRPGGGHPAGGRLSMKGSGDAHRRAAPSAHSPGARDPYLMGWSDYQTSIHFTSAHLTRWVPLVRRVVGRCDPPAPRDVALMMALIFVESGGRRYAVSRSGCLGLTQFCSRTAVRWPFGPIFGAAGLRSCACRHRRCKLHWEVRRFLEIMPRALHPVVAHEVPCDLADPRFDPERAIAAGWEYVSDLAGRFGHNPYMIYIGYNSGPHVAERIHRALGPERPRRLPQIGKVLRRALRPNFGRAWSRRRARSLVRVHLPKIQRAYLTYLEYLGELSAGPRASQPPAEPRAQAPLHPASTRTIRSPSRP